MVRSRNYIATPPGATIKEQLVDRGMSQKEFADRMGMSQKHISHLINGEVQLTPDMALRLEMVLGVPAQFWNNLEAIYREKLAKAKAENEMDADIELSKKFPYKEMAQNGWVENVKTQTEKVFCLRKFFEVANLSLLEKESLVPGIACRRMADGEKADYALYAWAQRAKLEARGKVVRPINVGGLQKELPQIRAMTRKNPSDFCPELVQDMADCGVSLIFLPHISGSFLHGATFYDKDKIVMGLTVRGKDADRFWFSLFHEVGHIVLGHIGQSGGTTQADEDAADAFARDILIDRESFTSFVQHRDFSRASILRFADRVSIDPGIVVGRLQKEGFVEYSWYKDLKTKYEITA